MVEGLKRLRPLEVPVTHALHSARFRDVPSEEELEEDGFGAVQEPEIHTYMHLPFICSYGKHFMRHSFF